MAGMTDAVVRWSLSAVSPTGKYVVTNAMALGLADGTDGTNGFLGMWRISISIMQKCR